MRGSARKCAEVRGSARNKCAEQVRGTSARKCAEVRGRSARKCAEVRGSARKCAEEVLGRTGVWCENCYASGAADGRCAQIHPKNHLKRKKSISEVFFLARPRIFSFLHGKPSAEVLGGSFEASCRLVAAFRFCKHSELTKAMSKAFKCL